MPVLNHVERIGSEVLLVLIKIATGPWNLFVADLVLAERFFGHDLAPTTARGPLNAVCPSPAGLRRGVWLRFAGVGDRERPRAALARTRGGS